MTDKPKCQNVDREKCACTSDVIHRCPNEAVIRIGGLNLCAEHADMILLALVKQINYLIDHGGIPTRDGDTGKLLAALEPK